MTNKKLLDPDMPADQLRLHMGELTASEVRVARSAIQWANSHFKAIIQQMIKEVEQENV